MPKKALLGVLILVLLPGLLFTACAQQEQEAPRNIGNFEFTPENYPLMGGSLAAQPLGEAVTATVLGLSRAEAADRIIFEGSTTSNYQGLVDGNFEIILAYEPSQEALDYAATYAFQWQATPICRDALVFIANRQNPVHDLTDAQVRAIYSGQIRNWQELGGADAEIIAYQRNRDSGSQTLFDKLIDLGDDLIEPPSDLLVGSMIGLLEVVADYDNAVDALGYTVYYYLANMETDKYARSQILSIDGVTCSNETIQSGAYPYVNDFYVVIPADLAADHPARVLYNWICSEQGKELAERENYVTVR